MGIFHGRSIGKATVALQITELARPLPFAIAWILLMAVSSNSKPVHIDVLQKGFHFLIHFIDEIFEGKLPSANFAFHKNMVAASLDLQICAALRAFSGSFRFSWSGERHFLS